ncbi:MAG: AbrB family transcriptional regulator [Candidatus Accumulibacter sp.]|nr:AbrB family transcriptional regulator [Accumulibacter sp.]
MPQVFHTKQFRAGNSAAVRIPAEMAFPPQTALIVIRDGNRIIVEPETLQDVPGLFAALGRHHTGKRPECVETERNWK